ncbi:response regulator [Caulobacter segnis]
MPEGGTEVESRSLPGRGRPSIRATRRWRRPCLGGDNHAHAIQSSPIRVLIVDDHAVVRDGVTALLNRQPDMEAVGEAADGAEAVVQFQSLSPDVTLVDLQMRGMSGTEAIKAIRRLSPKARLPGVDDLFGRRPSPRGDPRRCGRLSALKAAFGANCSTRSGSVHGGGAAISAPTSPMSWRHTP